MWNKSELVFFCIFCIHDADQSDNPRLLEQINMHFIKPNYSYYPCYGQGICTSFLGFTIQCQTTNCPIVTLLYSFETKYNVCCCNKRNILCKVIAQINVYVSKTLHIWFQNWDEIQNIENWAEAERSRLNCKMWTVNLTWLEKRKWNSSWK